MESLDLRVLADALAWRQAGHMVSLLTVVETWGSAPRPAGALLALRADGVLSGSVSGGCIEDDLICRAKASLAAPPNVGEVPARPSMLAYGVTQDEAARFGLPCGGSLRLVHEPLVEFQWIVALLARVRQHEVLVRELHLPSGVVRLLPMVHVESGEPRMRGPSLQFDGTTLSSAFGPSWRLLLIGAGQLSQAVAQIAQMLDFEVLICDPREEYTHAMQTKYGRLLSGMPDDVVRDIVPDPHTAIIALSHDPKLDDMALLEALGSSAFYVGALGSQRNQAARKKRLAEHFDIPKDALDRLHGPVGLSIAAKTPAEIAVAIIAHLIQIRNSSSTASLSAQPAICLNASLP